MVYYIVFPSVWVLCGVACAFIASSKGRSGVAWFFIGCLTGIIGLIYILFAKKPHGQDESFNPVTEVKYECEKCGNSIIVSKKELKNIDVIVCQNCNNEIDVNHEVKEKDEDKDFLNIECPDCGEELSFERKSIKGKSQVTCPFCDSKIRIK